MTAQRRELFDKIIWGDYRLTPDDVEVILQGSSKHKTMIYRKILMTERWYNIMRILSKTELKEALSDDVLNTIWVKTLRSKYDHARRILYGTSEKLAA
jgi:hypothetical protein